MDDAQQAILATVIEATDHGEINLENIDDELWTRWIADTVRPVIEAQVLDEIATLISTDPRPAVDRDRIALMLRERPENPRGTDG